MTTASFQLSGKIPDSNELLIMLVITGISGSLQDFSKCVGMGSRQQDVDLEFAMSIRTSSSANSSKASIRVGGIVESLFPTLSFMTLPDFIPGGTGTSYAVCRTEVTRFEQDGHQF